MSAPASASTILTRMARSAGCSPTAVPINTISATPNTQVSVVMGSCSCPPVAAPSSGSDRRATAKPDQPPAQPA